MTTEIVQFDRNAALAGPDNCELILSDGQAFDMISSAFPGNLDPQRRRDKAMALTREATIHIANSKARDKICRCVSATVLDSLASCARLDLSLTKAIGHAYLVPFNGVCTLMVGYKGFIKLVIETGLIRHLETVVVYEGDDFKFWRDEKGPHLEHVPCPESQGDEKKLRLVYLVAITADGGTMFEMMNRKEIDKVRKASKSATDGPWAYWYTEMARKSVIRRWEKSVPKGMETPAEQRLAEALELDNSQFDPTKLAGYKELADAHSKSLKDQAMAPIQGDAPVSIHQIDKFMERVAAKRDGDSSLDDADFVAAVLVAEFGAGATLSELTMDQFKHIGQTLAGGAYDWATGEKLPDMPSDE